MWPQQKKMSSQNNSKSKRLPRELNKNTRNEDDSILCRIMFLSLSGSWLHVVQTFCLWLWYNQEIFVCLKNFQTLHYLIKTAHISPIIFLVECGVQCSYDVSVPVKCNSIETWPTNVWIHQFVRLPKKLLSWTWDRIKNRRWKYWAIMTNAFLHRNFAFKEDTETEWICAISNICYIFTISFAKKKWHRT